MEGTSRCTLGSQAQHTHSLEDHTRSIQHSTSTHTRHFHNIQQQNNNHTQHIASDTQHTRQADPLTEQYLLEQLLKFQNTLNYSSLFSNSSIFEVLPFSFNDH